MKNLHFPKQIKRILEVLGYTQTLLATKLEVSQGIISEFASGAREPSKEFIFGISKLGISIDWFLTGQGEMFLSPVPVAAQSEGGKSEIDFGFGHNQASPKVPLLRQKVSCGEGVSWDDEQNIVDYIDVFSLPHLNVKRLFALCVDGSSMLGAGIYNGDYVLFDGSYDQPLKDGIYVFALDGDVFCKRLEYDRISKKISVFSVRFADLDKAELITTIDMRDASTQDRLTIFGPVLYWIHPNSDDR